MKTIVHIVGNRPQLIKLAVLHKELSGAGLFQQKIVHTGQHFSYEMSGLFFKELDIPPPDINLGIQDQSANLFVARVADGLQDYFARTGQCIAFVYGDTNTTLAAAIAAKRSGIQLVHFEAGVRTGDMSMPEEMNRVLTDRLADINLCCTGKNYSRMLAEGFGNSIATDIHLTGDLMLDAFIKLHKSEKRIIVEDKYVACTIHRAASINNSESLHEIIAALNLIHEQIPVVVPLHPHTKKMMATFGCQPVFKILDPLGYPDMKLFLSVATAVITDSGGTCREAYFLSKKALVVMENPFWPEIIEAGCALAVPPKKEMIVNSFFELPRLQADFAGQIFGDGHAAVKIKEILAAL